MNNKLNALALITVFFLQILFLTACNSGWRQPFPDADIVFQTGEPSNPQIGFVNADGSGGITLDIPQYLIKPVWGSDGTYLVGMVRRISVLGGYPFYWEQGQRIKICKQMWGGEEVVGFMEANTNQVLINHVNHKVLLADLNDCTEEAVLVDVGNTNTYIFGISIAPDQQSFLYSVAANYYTDQLTITIYSQSLADPKSVQELGSGIYPAWAPDGQHIAYVNFDGIYIMQADGSNSARIVEADFRERSNLKEFGILSPMPDWSPDGNWLIYHRCEQEIYIEDCAIYKVEIATGKQTFIAVGGYPNWRP